MALLRETDIHLGPDGFPESSIFKNGLLSKRIIPDSLGTFRAYDPSGYLIDEPRFNSRREIAFFQFLNAGFQLEEPHSDTFSILPLCDVFGAENEVVNPQVDIGTQNTGPRLKIITNKSGMHFVKEIDDDPNIVVMSRDQRVKSPLQNHWGVSAHGLWLPYGVGAVLTLDNQGIITINRARFRTQVKALPHE